MPNHEPSPPALYLAAVVQLTCGTDPEANFRQAEELVARAAGYGAQLVATPENANFLGPERQKVERAESLDGPTCRRYSALAARLGIYLLLGSFNERSAEAGRCHNTSVVFGPDGDRLAVYRKLHLFDVAVSESVSFRESETVAAGREVVVTETAVGQLGLSVCYDLRFPELYRRLVDGGAELLTVPSAFTLSTGKDHWLPLLRARAIECQSYVLAPAQWGRHDPEGRRESWGHSMIVDPWGEPLASAADGPGLALAEIDLDRLRRLRRAMPVAEHRQL